MGSNFYISNECPLPNGHFEIFLVVKSNTLGSKFNNPGININPLQTCVAYLYLLKT